MNPNQSHIAGLEMAYGLAQMNSFPVSFEFSLEKLIDQARSTPEPVQGETVEVVAWMKHELCTRLYFHAPPEPSIPLMTVAQHNRIMAAATQPDVQVPVTGSLDEIDAPVWPFINEEARKVGAEKGRIETYQYERANGGVVVLWDGPRVHAMAVTIRDDLNRTRCIRMLATPSASAQGWISVDDRLPDEHKAEYLCLFAGGQQQVTEWLLDDTDGWVFWYGEPTHWMPLLAAPTEPVKP